MKLPGETTCLGLAGNLVKDRLLDESLLDHLLVLVELLQILHCQNIGSHDFQQRIVQTNASIKQLWALPPRS